MSAAIEIAGGACLIIGACFCVVGGIGLLRMPDLYSRTHAASITDTLGAGLMLLGLMLHEGPTLVTVKLLLVLALLWTTSPLAAHALARSAHAHGCDPKLIEGSDGLPD
jgi:multicomponent Na+:H+ antiporter subunit G